MRRRVPPIVERFRTLEPNNGVGVIRMQRTRARVLVTVTGEETERVDGAIVRVRVEALEAAVVAPAEPSTSTSVRQVVTEMVAEARTVDRPALVERVERALAEVGL